VENQRLSAGADDLGCGTAPPGGQCLTTDTPILTADGAEKLVGEIDVRDIRTILPARIASLRGG
jgi:hypothetical protein